MKLKSLIIITILAAISLLFIAFEYSQAAKDKTITPKIGIVSIKEVLEKCSMKAENDKLIESEMEKKLAELKKLEQTIADEKSALDKRKENSRDYLELLRSIVLKQSELEAKDKFYRQELEIKDLQEQEKIYRKIVSVIAAVAKEKGLDLIFNRDDNYLTAADTSVSAPTPQDYIITLKTHKLLYYNPAFDITDSVVTAINNKTE